MASPIGKKEVEHLAELSRIKLDAREEEKFVKDLQKILGHFEELKELDTSSVEPVNGGTELKNVFREDGGDESPVGTNRGAGTEQFSQKRGGYLEIPPVFE